MLVTPSFPFGLERKANGHNRTVTALDCVELAKVMAIAGIQVAVLLIHPNHCMCFTTGGKGSIVSIMFPV